MSVHYLYRRPEEERVCPVCHRVIQRNIFRYGNDLLHLGCYRKLQAKENRAKITRHGTPRILASIPGTSLPERGRWD